MTGFILRRVVQLIPVLVFISAIVFSVFRIIPGDAVAVAMGEGADRESAESMRRQLGLDRPLVVQYLVVQYVDWLGSALRGDLGFSLINRQSVLSLVQEKLPATLQLMALSMLLALSISLPVGILAALKRGTWVDQVARVSALTGAAARALAAPRGW